MKSNSFLFIESLNKLVSELNKDLKRVGLEGDLKLVDVIGRQEVLTVEGLLAIDFPRYTPHVHFYTLDKVKSLAGVKLFGGNSSLNFLYGIRDIDGAVVYFWDKPEGSVAAKSLDDFLGVIHVLMRVEIMRLTRLRDDFASYFDELLDTIEIDRHIQFLNLVKDF